MTRTLLAAAALAAAGLAPAARAETVNCMQITALPATLTTQGVYCLKKDLTSMFEPDALPGEFLNGKLYQSTKTLTTSLAADPNWSALQGYYKSPKFITKPETLPTYSAPPVDLVDVAATRRMTFTAP